MSYDEDETLVKDTCRICKKKDVWFDTMTPCIFRICQDCLNLLNQARDAVKAHRSVMYEMERVMEKRAEMGEL